MDIIAYCGFNCAGCPVYIATAGNDSDMKDKLAKEYSAPECAFAAADMTCEGCLSESSDVTRMCAPCEMRICARAQGTTCAVCARYPCSTVDHLMPSGTHGREVLNALAKESQ